MKIKTIILGLFVSTSIYAQQIGDGRAVQITDFTVPLKSGGYQAINPTGKNPDGSHDVGWQHLFVVRHSNNDNNYQLQLSSSYTINDRLFFRKMATGGLSSINPTWIELATRGTNNFTGDQYIAGKVGIGTTVPDSKLTVKGSIHAQEVKVDLLGAVVPDYVFAEDYQLKTLPEVEKYIKENHHLPEIPSAKEIEQNGLMLAEMNLNLLKKIEEMTLHLIEQNKVVTEQQKAIEALKKSVAQLEIVLQPRNR